MTDRAIAHCTSTALHRYKTTVHHDSMNSSTHSTYKCQIYIEVICLPGSVQYLKHNSRSHVTTSYFHWELNVI